MIRIYVEEGLDLNKIAEMLGRSSRTPLMQIQRHNNDVVERTDSIRYAKGSEARSMTIRHVKQTPIRF